MLDWLRPRAPRPSPAGAGGLNWQPNTAYQQGAVAISSSVLYSRNTAGVSAASFGADASNWTVIGAPTELGYAEITTSQPPSPFINNTSYIDIPGLSVTVTVGSRPILVLVNGTVQAITVNATTGGFAVLEDGTVLDQQSFDLPAAQFQGSPVAMRVRSNPAAGSHTYKVQGKVGNATNTAWLVAQATAPKQKASIQVLQV
jgi:hypothetical protein